MVITSDLIGLKLETTKLLGRTQARPTLSTQKQLAHNAYLFGNVDVVAPVRPRSQFCDINRH